MEKQTKLAILFGAIGVAGAAYGINCHVKMNKLAKALDTTIDKLSNNVEFEITDKVVSKVVEKRLGDEIKKAANKVADEVSVAAKDEIKRKAGEAVKETYSTLKDKVSDEILEKVSKIDMSALQKEVTDKASDKAMEYLETNIDNIANQYDADLNHALQVYSLIARNTNA